VRLWVVLALAGALVAGCGDDGGGTQTPASELAVPWIDPDGDPPIVGSLSVNPADNTLFMATNTGLFRIPEGASEPERLVGQLETPDGSGEVSEALVVRFTGPDTLIGSGHPASGSSLPQALGLISSDDAGKTWSSVSELGTADFHALEPVGADIVAALFQQPQVLVSADAGKTWETRAAPLPLVALEVDPRNSEAWIGSTDRGIFVSEDAGQTWRQRDPTPNSRFAWTEDGTLYRVDPGGQIKVSSDSGLKWEDRGSTGGEPQAMTVDADGKLYVALIDGTLKVSDDDGQTFSDQIQGG
jgi:photosynthesis system II assembly factor YCF48-like protein